jgi:YD repeat-containing protein
LRGAAWLQLAEADGVGETLRRLVLAGAASAQARARAAGAQAAAAATSFARQVVAPAPAGPLHQPAVAGVGVGVPALAGLVPADPRDRLKAALQQPGDWFSLWPSAESAASDPKGISLPWKPTSRAGGGAALPPRGGSGNGALPFVVALVQGHAAPPHAAPAPSAPATIPAIYAPKSPASVAPGDFPGPVGTPKAPAVRVHHGKELAPTPLDCGCTGGSPGGPGGVPENPSSLPSSSAGSGSGTALPSFPYFPLYTLDYNNGIVLFPNQYQLVNLAGTTDLYAQVKGTSGLTYSWTLAGGLTSSYSGSGTYHLHVQWEPFNGSGANAIETVTLQVTDTNNHQESQTYYFVVPPSNVVTLPSSASWPVTISPDTVEPGAPAIPSQYVSVDADSGAVDSVIPLPSYNPNVPALSMVYNSLTADPRPIVLVHHTLDSSQSVPTMVNATLTFNNTPGTTWYYNTSGSQFIPGDIEQIALQANGTGLSTGRYSYTVQVLDQRSTNTTFTYNGTATVLNQSTSPFGDGWTLQALEQIIAPTGAGGVILTLGNNGESLWFSGNPGVGQNYTSPAGDFSTLTKTSSGYTRTLTNGLQINFNSSGYQSSIVDLNGLHTTFSWNGSNQLSTITDPYGNVTTFTYSSGYLQTIKDPAGRLTSFTFSGASLSAVQQADGSRVTLTYDSAGRMTQYKDANSNVVSVVYDSVERASTITRPDGSTQVFSAYQEQGWTNSGTSGNPAPATLLAESATTYTDPNGNAFQTRPDWMGLGQLGQGLDAYGNVTSLDLNSNGEPNVAIDGLNRISQFNYDSSGNPVTITYPDLTADHYTYNSNSEPLTHTDGNNHTTSYTYDSHGNMTGIKDPLNNLTTLTYTPNGRVQTITDANNHTTSFQYDNQDRMTTIQFPDGTTNVFGYNSQGNVINATDGRADSTTFSYDALNRKTGWTDALNDVATLTYDGNGNILKDQEPTPSGQTARTTTYAYDSMNRLGTVTNALGYQTVYGHDFDGNVTTIKDPLGRATTIQYDAMDRPVVVIDPRGNSTTVTYDADGEMVTVADQLNRTTSYAYSVRGWLAQVTDPLGYLTTYTYSATGKLLGTYHTQGSLLTSQTNYYDADDRLATYTDELGKSTTMSYDGVGGLTSVTDPNGNTTTGVYDPRNRLVEVVEPLGVTVSFTYDGSGNRQTATDALGHTSTVLYDALNRATTIISAIGGTTTISYDAASREVSFTDPVGNRTQWAYDSLDRLATLTQPNGHTVTYVYNKDNELTDTTDENGRRTTFSYDPNGNQTGETWVGASPSELITYTFDKANQLTGAVDSFATLTFSYDNDGRLQTDATSGPGTGQPAVTLTYGYDQVGDETSVTDSLSSQGLTTYSFDADRRMTLITTNYGGTAFPQISFGYDPGNRLTSISRQIGSSTTATEVNTSIV